MHETCQISFQLRKFCFLFPVNWKGDVVVMDQNDISYRDITSTESFDTVHWG